MSSQWYAESAHVRHYRGQHRAIGRVSALLLTIGAWLVGAR